MFIFIAGNFDDKERLKEIAYKLSDDNCSVVSSWLWEKGNTRDVGEFAEIGFAIRDAYEVQAASLLILDTLSETRTGGREVEYGMALARGIPTAIVGPKRNLHHRLARFHFDNWDECIAYVKMISGAEGI